MPYHFFPMIARMRYISRWGLMRNTDPENVQEHSHMVAVLAHALAVIENERFSGQTDPGVVAVAALYHDASEILTGDMPTPIKYDNPDIQTPCAGPGKGGGQALRLPQVPGGAEGGEHRVPQGQGADLRRAPSEPAARPALLYGGVPPWL